MYVFVGFDKAREGVILVGLDDFKTEFVHSTKIKGLIAQNKIINIVLKDGKIVGTNGSLANYGVVGEKNVPVILKVGTKYNSKRGRDEAFEFILSSTDGKVVKYNKSKAIELFANKGLANGRVVIREGVEPYVSAIRGSYPSYKLKVDELKSTKEVKKIVPKKVYTKEDILNLISVVLKEKAIDYRVSLGDFYGDVCITKGDYDYEIRTEICEDGLQRISFQVFYDIEKYASASFIEEKQDYDGWYKVIDGNNPDYIRTLKSYNYGRLKVRESKAYTVLEESSLELGDKDWLSYVHFVNIKFNKPLKITKGNIAKIISNLY